MQISPRRSVIIAGAGIGGLTAALALARSGYRVDILEQAERLEPIGAGLQLSPNASRILIGLGLAERLLEQAVAPEALQVLEAATGRTMAQASLHDAERTFGAPYWVMHRGDLQAALMQAVAADPAISLHLGERAQAVATHAKGITVASMSRVRPVERHASALVCADGLWSDLRQSLGLNQRPRFAGYVAWRALVPADAVAPSQRAAALNLWLGRGAHIVQYPVSGGRLINVVAIVRDDWHESGWRADGERAELLAHFPARRWHAEARGLLAAAAHWQKWALHDLAPVRRWSQGPVTLLGDAAHPMLPYLAQGAAMAIEDAIVLAGCVRDRPDDPATAFAVYERKRKSRTARAQRAARRNGMVYHMGGAGLLLRTIAMAGMRSTGLLRPYRWLYNWRPD